MKYIKDKAEFINEAKKSKKLNEGQFSWLTQDTGKQIGSERQNTIDVYMYDDKGNKFKERKYDGYGNFGGKDYYDLLANMNGYLDTDVDKMSQRDLRNVGIDLAFGKLKTKDPKKKVLFPALVEDPRFNWKKHDFTEQPENDPDQSWYQEEESEEDYYESAVAEGMSWNDVAKVMDAGLKKAKVPLSYARDYVKSLERMAKRNAKKFFAEYGNFSEDDFIEDAEYNLANESKVTEARFVKDFDEAVLNAKTKEEVSKLYPKAEFFVGKSDHFFGELEPNLFFKAYYTKGQKEFNIKSVYSKKGSNYIHLYNKLGESVVNESSGSEERRIALRAMKSIAKYLNRDLRTSAQYLINAAEDVQRDIEKGKVK